MNRYHPIARRTFLGPIQNLGQLKGKKIAFNKGSDVHWLVVNAVQKAGLKYSARVLTDATGIVNRYQYFLTARPYAEKRPEIVAIVLEEIGKTGEWIRGNFREAAPNSLPFRAWTRKSLRRVSGITSTSISRSTKAC